MKLSKLDIVTLDFETYYNNTYTLKKMTTEEYIRDPLFEIICVGVKVNNNPVDVYSGKSAETFLRSLDYSKCAVLCHNTAFDGAILSWRLGIKPKFFFDTLSMARALHGAEVGGSLSALATYYSLGDKGKAVTFAQKRREELAPHELEALMEYCGNDVELTYKLFKKLVPSFPLKELQVIDLTVKMFTDPKVHLDPNVLAQILVITAGLAPTGDSEYSVDDHRFLREMYQSGLGNYDHIGIGVHPYGWGNPPDARCCNLDDERGWDDSTHFFFIETLETYRNIMIENGDQNHQLWLTEVGWATWDRLSGEPPQVWMGYNDVFDQGHYTIRAIEIGNSLDYVGGMFLWNLNFGLPVLVENRDERVAYSMTISGANPVERPVYWMIYDAVRPMERLNHYEGRP